MMDYYLKTYIQNLEQHLTDPNMSDKDDYPASRMKLYNDFVSAVGYTPNEYIRRRRLSIALSLITTSDISMTEISHACGYSSQQAFCREIKSILGITAKEYKKGNMQYFFPQYDGAAVLPVSVIQHTIPETVELIYLSTCLKNIETHAVELFLKNNPAYTGCLFGRNGKQHSTHFSYIIFVDHEYIERINTEGFIVSSVHESYSITAAGTSTTNHEEKISYSWDYLYNKWLLGSMYMYAGLDKDDFRYQYFEEYLYKNGSTVPYRLKLYLPVIKRDDYSKLLLTNYKANFLVCREQGWNAEKKASEKIIRFICENYPYAMTSPTELLRIRNGVFCTCGVRISEQLSINSESFVSFSIDSLCVVYEQNGLGDPEDAGHIVNQWMHENHIKKSAEPFEIFTVTDDRTDMKIVCPVNPV